MNTFLGTLPLLQTANAGGQMVTTLVTFGLVILIFYFMIIRPQNKQRKELQAMIDAVKRGDKVVTAGGIRATVENVKDKTVILKVDEKVKMEFNKSAISEVLNAKKSQEKVTDFKKGKK